MSTEASSQRIYIPTLDELGELEQVYSVTAPERWRDYNDHVNVLGHYEFLMHTLHYGLMSMGITPDYIQTHGRSTFTLEQHVTFAHEIQIGAKLGGYVRLVDRNAKLLRGVAIAANLTTGDVASMAEFADIHVDMSTRRSTAWNDELGDKLDQRLAHDRQLSWLAPDSGSLKLR
ncbi:MULTISPECIES: thioesterase family protein [Auritidibacter]|uniref:thioesterase family protein n=1 Tax=Auritidibacter TaxID=1160973 RepID=UPI000D73CFD6|nr:MULTISPECIES: thioesterase family protein [Auritidibacter]NIH72543.1 acyl-CoA thioester hydrolase [Auritidibacter ignavus]PXA76539.1 hypothetical protein DCC24_07170 [Auritidibacter sp. NML100628]RMX22645.1 thioesterase [Auritidibacter ignavus]WGH83419.1 thioesterase family protein [Auritidibacter ignavus]WGH90116.1 thioesterase family protein [Auritidibacter ignavus]